MRSKEFKKGMEAGAKPFEEKFEKQAEKVEEIGNKLESGLENILSINDAIIEELSSMEKKSLYDLNTLIDIADIDETEKELLMAVLYTLSARMNFVNPEQQSYIRSVKKYLNIYDVQTLDDLSVIGNIDSKKVERAILQCVLEFLFLEACNHDYWDEYEEILDYFDVKKSEIRRIEDSINKIYSAVGVEGIAEKYGYVPECEEKESNELLGKGIPVDIAKEIRRSLYVVLPDYIVFADFKKMIVIDRNNIRKEVMTEIYIKHLYMVDSTTVLISGSGYIIKYCIVDFSYEIICNDCDRDANFIVIDSKILYSGSDGLKIIDCITKSADYLYVETNSIKEKIAAEQFVAIENNIYFTINGCSGNKWLCNAETAQVYDEYKNYREKIFCFDLITKNCKALCQVGFCDLFYFENTLYAVTYKNYDFDDRGSDYSIHKISILENGNTNIEKFEIAGKCSFVTDRLPYLVFAARKSPFSVQVFNLSNEKIRMLTDGLGYTFLRKTFFREETVHYYHNNCYIVDNWLYVEKGKDKELYRYNLISLSQEKV